MSELVTGEAVPLELRLARFPSRALAIILDWSLLGLVAIVVLAVVQRLALSADPALASAMGIAAFVVLFVGVPLLVETLTRGRSLGKLALGLRVVRDDGGPVRFRHALIRALAGVFADFLLTLGAGAVICSLLNERGKRVGDLLAGTVVVRERAPATSRPLPAVPPLLARWAIGLEFSRLPAELALAARGYLARYPELSAAVRDRMGAQLATEVARFVTPAAPPGTPAWAYLAAVLAERGRREAARLSAGPAARQAGAAAKATSVPAAEGVAAPVTPAPPAVAPPPQPSPPAGLVPPS